MRDVVLSRRHRLSARPRKTRRAGKTLKSLLKAGTCRLVKQWSRASGVRKVRGWAAANHREPAGTTESGPPALWFTLFGGRWYVEGLPRDCAKKQAGHTLEDVLFLEDIPRVIADIVPENHNLADFLSSKELVLIA